MKGFKYFWHISCVWVLLVAVSVYGQIRTPCTASMINSFTPCLNFITQSSANGSSPTADCCSSLKSLTSSSMDCACLIITGNVPFQIPINRSLAISLPRACKMDGVPLQCKASGSPVPAPASSIPEPAPSPEPDRTSALTPMSPPPTDSTDPTAVPGLRPALTPNSAANFSHISLSYVLLFVLGSMVFTKFS